MQQQERFFSTEQIDNYITYLQEQERSQTTIKKYRHILIKLCQDMDGGVVSKATLIEWKNTLTNDHAPASVNTMLTCVNGFLTFLGWNDLSLKLLKLQANLFLDDRKELTRAEYTRLVQTAQSHGKERLALLLQTICATGIRISELQYITAEAVFCGRAHISNKGKHRVVFLPEKLCRLLKQYLKKEKKTAGAVFTTRNGKPLDRSNIWRDMKAICEIAHVDKEKVFPHNLRHLFARTFYTLEQDLSRLADILGHSSINTTRIYTAESGRIHAQQMERTELVVISV